MKTRRLKNLTHTEKCEIYNMGIFGKYSIKEICDRFSISPVVYRKIMNSFKEFLTTGNVKEELL